MIPENTNRIPNRFIDGVAPLLNRRPPASARADSGGHVAGSPCLSGVGASSPPTPHDKAALLRRSAGALLALSNHLAAYVPASTCRRLEDDAAALQSWAQEEDR